MALYLVGENIDKYRSHYQAGIGKLIQFIRGIYIDASDDIETIVLQYAVRMLTLACLLPLLKEREGYVVCTLGASSQGL